MVELMKERAQRIKAESSLAEFMKLAEQEIRVNEQIREKQEWMIGKLKKELKEVKTIIKIPRLRHIHMN